MQSPLNRRHTQVAVLIKHYAQVMDGKQKEVLDKVFG